MNKTFEKGEDLVRVMGQDALGAFYVVARNNVKATWNRMSRKEKYDAGRALALMARVAANPDKYLSRAQTDAAWCERAQKYAAAKGIDENYAYCIVSAPNDIVTSAAMPALTARRYGSAELWSEYYNLTQQIMRYDYLVTITRGGSSLVNENAEKIMRTANRMAKRAAVSSAPVWKRPLVMLAWNGR